MVMSTREEADRAIRHMDQREVGAKVVVAEGAFACGHMSGCKYIFREDVK